jgi:non-ribosomal peptide synthase protein (TIGR01720 family)
VPGVYRTQINDVLLAALARAMSGWTGASRVVVELEGHGREELFAEVDLSRTVGWLTILYPVALDLGGCSGPGELLKSIKEQLREIPNRGLGHGLLRHLRDDETGRQVRGLAPAQLRFNYLGQFDQVLPESGMLSAAAESGGEERSREGLRRYLLDVNGRVAGGRLRLDWTYSEAVHRRETVEALAGSFLRTLQELIEHCRSPEAGGFTPSDFPLAELDQAALERVAELIAGDL